MSDTNLDTFTTFGQLLKYLRRRARLTQRELGIAAGYSDAQIARLEGDQRQPDPVAVKARFLDALDLNAGSEQAIRLIELANATQKEAEAESSQRIPNNLPAQVTSFVGRERELAELTKLVNAARLITLTGSGGVGKTRLALELAGQLLDRFKDGVWLIELAPVADPAFVPRAVAAVLSVREGSGQPLMASILDELCGKRVLLLLDNCEHLIDACAQFADAVLRDGPGPRLLATSREALNVPGELTWRVPSLQMPPAGDPLGLMDLAHYEAVRLFVERAVFAIPSFVLTDANAPAVRQIITRLDGIPLAIEMAAARVKALSPERIAERLSDRFHLLTGGSRTALPRQQTLRATIDWSYNLLSEPERILLRRLTVFVGGWTLEACEAVCASDGIEPGDVLDPLTTLVDKSLVVMQAGESGEHERYRLLETIRQYARERLVDTDETRRVRDRHLDYFVRLFDEAEPALEQTLAPVVSRLTPEIDNVRVALGWAIETGRIDDGLRLGEASSCLTAVHGLRLESIYWRRVLLDQPVQNERTPTRARALAYLAWNYLQEGMIAEAEAAAQQALALGLVLGYVPSQRHATCTLALTAAQRGDFAQAHAYIVKLRDWQDVFNMPEAARRIAEGIGLYHWYSLTAVGQVWFEEGQYVEARRVFTHAVAMAQACGDTDRTSTFARNLGYTMLYQGDPRAAAAQFQVSLSLNAEGGDRQAVAACLAALGAAALMQGDLRRAARLYGSSEAICESIHVMLLLYDRVAVQRHTAELRTQLDQASLATAWAEGHSMTYDQAIDYALAGM
jgi:predicted ATPase